MLCRPCCTAGELIIPGLTNVSEARGTLHPTGCCPDCQQPATKGDGYDKAASGMPVAPAIVTLPLPLEKEEQALELVFLPAPCSRRPLTPHVTVAMKGTTHPAETTGTVSPRRTVGRVAMASCQRRRLGIVSSVIWKTANALTHVKFAIDIVKLLRKRQSVSSA
jgi:hypothetical protein